MGCIDECVGCRERGSQWVCMERSARPKVDPETWDQPRIGSQYMDPPGRRLGLYVSVWRGWRIGVET